MEYPIKNRKEMRGKIICNVNLQCLFNLAFFEISSKRLLYSMKSMTWLVKSSSWRMYSQETMVMNVQNGMARLKTSQ